MSIDPINFGVFLLKETLTYKNQIFNDDNLIIQLLSDKKIEPLDTVWIKNTSILDGGPGVIQMTSFVAERKDLDIQLVCMDYSILSEQLLREEIVTLIQRAG